MARCNGRVVAAATGSGKGVVVERHICNQLRLMQACLGRLRPLVEWP